MHSTTLGDEAVRRCLELREISVDPHAYTRLAFTPEHARALERIGAWMRGAGLAVRRDAAGNLIGRLEGAQPGLPALLLGSHQDTVRDAGSFDGMLGIVSAIAAAAHFARAGTPLPFALEVHAFTDEEGTRFSTSYLGSGMVAGTLGADVLERRDRDGIGLAQAMRAFGLDPDGIGAARRRPDEVIGWLELHIEQGPVLEAEGLSVGAVTGIAGQTRLAVALEGVAGHAGTVPMRLRRDALAGAAEAIAAVESLARAHNGTVATVGQIAAEPGATNVIPGRVRFTIDARAPEDTQRRALLDAIRARLSEIAQARGLALHVETTNDDPAVACDPALVAHARAACEAVAGRAVMLPSGAGHDAVALSALCPVAMLFLRCRGGVSHNPAEHVDPEDAQAGIESLIGTIERIANARSI